MHKTFLIFSNDSRYVVQSYMVHNIYRIALSKELLHYQLLTTFMCIRNLNSIIPYSVQIGHLRCFVFVLRHLCFVPF